MTNQRRRKWAKHVAAWRASGLSSEEYGPKLGVTGRCVRRWEQKLKQGRSRKRVVKPRLMRVEVVAAPSEQPVVVSVGRRRVEVMSGFSRSTLAAVLEVVEAQS